MQILVYAYHQLAVLYLASLHASNHPLIQSLHQALAKLKYADPLAVHQWRIHPAMKL